MESGAEESDWLWSNKRLKSALCQRSRIVEWKIKRPAAQASFYLYLTAEDTCHYEE